MRTEIGQVEAIFRYPVKSMAGERLESANLGWHGVEVDRRLAFRRVEDRGGFPWLSAGRLPELLLYAPQRQNGAKEDIPTHVRTPDGKELPIFGEELAAEVTSRFGAPLQMMQLKHGIFDEAKVSVIATATVDGVARLAKRNPDVRQFRPNILVRSVSAAPFHEDEWVGGVISFGGEEGAAQVTITMQDERCGMLNLDPDTGRSAPEMFKAVVRENQSNAGVYGAVTRIGQIKVGQSIFLHSPK